MDYKTKIYSAFPGVGKTYFYNNSDLKVLDSDSSTFDKKDFPANYIRHIKENMDKVDIILVSSHDVVREALKKNDIKYTLVYPEISLKEEYKERFSKRGSPKVFIELLDKYWDAWVKDAINESGCEKVELKSGEFITDKL